MTSIKFRALTHNDYKLFFEAIGEHGKDFQNIQQYMAQKCGKTSNKSNEQNKSSIDPQDKREQEKKEEDKKREQIRNFYNKLYGKLSQLIGKLDDRVEKVNQELYLLINYGEIWKKHGFKFNNKTKKLLEELVHQGSTTLRFKNKNVRLRTPPCKALKKINKIGIDEKVKVVTARELPKDVIVEFHPATNRDWLKVQSISQNPRVRARLSIQKRLCNILEFLENKWNISQEKLNRTVDVWLKVPPNQLSIEDSQPYHQQHNDLSFSNGDHINGNVSIPSNSSSHPTPGVSDGAYNDFHHRIRLRPSNQHELNEVNITRVVPDNHLDLSLNSFIKRLIEANPRSGVVSPNRITANYANNNNLTMISSHNILEEGINLMENSEMSQGTMSSNSRLPISLTTPDSSILLERSMTCDQPSIAQARKHLNILQSLAGCFEGCENSRTACEDTSNRSLTGLPIQADGCNPLSTSFGGRTVSFASNDQSDRKSLPTIPVSESLPEFFDENAASETVLPSTPTETREKSELIDSALSTFSDQLNHLELGQNSKSVDFNIPKDVTVGDWFKMNDPNGGGDDANDAFPLQQPQEQESSCQSVVPTGEGNGKVEDPINKEHDPIESSKVKTIAETNNLSKYHNHVIEIKKFAEGWTRQDETSLSIGELYLAFKCPEKLVLEYEFEQFSHRTHSTAPSDVIPIRKEVDSLTGSLHNATTTIISEGPSNNTLIFKLLTAASLSLAHIERQKLEQQHKLHDQPGAKLKRRKGPSNPNTLKYLKRDDNISTDYLRASVSGQLDDRVGVGNALVASHQTDNNNYICPGNDKIQGQGHARTLHDVKTTNQLVGEALKQLQPTRLTVFKRAR